jgi:acyl carrier protein
MSTNMHAEICTFIAAHLQARGFAAPRDNFEALDFFESGAIDSLGAMRFAAALEEKFDFELSDEDILSDDFRHVGGVIQLVLRAIARRQTSAA